MEVSASTAPAATSNGVVPSSPFPTIEPERLVEYLVDVCKAALGATQEELEEPGNPLHASRYKETASRCSRFAADTQNVLYIQKDIATSSAVGNGTDTAGKIFGHDNIYYWLTSNPL